MKRTLVLASAVLLLVTACMATPAMAAEPYKLTFNASVHVPGATLGPGTYLFTPIAMRVIQVTSVDHKTLYTTFMTLPRYRAEITKENVVAFSEAPPDVAPPVSGRTRGAIRLHRSPRKPCRQCLLSQPV